MTAITNVPAAEETRTRLLWLDLTRTCQLSCSHCYNGSGPDGTHGTMTREEWVSVLDQAAACGVRGVQFIGGEPTMHPDFHELVDHALGLGLHVEVFSNLVHVSRECWELFQRDGLSLATSYYSDRSEEHDTVTGRPSHARTRANIGRAVGLGIPLRVGVITAGGEERAAGAVADLSALGVERVGVDYVRPFGRGAQGAAQDPAGLCGRCAHGRASVGPTGEVSPCVFSTWMSVGNVKTALLDAIVTGTAMAEANAAIRSAVRSGAGMAGCEPGCSPNDSCGPGFPGSECSPRS